MRAMLPKMSLDCKIMTSPLVRVAPFAGFDATWALNFQELTKHQPRLNVKALFNQKGVWQDSSIQKDAKLRKVKLYSAEFFSLLDGNPWLNRVIVRGGQLYWKINGEYISFAPSEGSSIDEERLGLANGRDSVGICRDKSDNDREAEAG